MSNLRLLKGMEGWLCEQCGIPFRVGQSVNHGFYCHDCAPIVMRAQEIADMCNEELEEEADSEEEIEEVSLSSMSFDQLTSS